MQLPFEANAADEFEDAVTVTSIDLRDATRIVAICTCGGERQAVNLGDPGRARQRRGVAAYLVRARSLVHG